MSSNGVYFIWVASLLFCAECFASPGVISVVGATWEEQLQLSQWGTGDDCLQVRIGALNTVIRDHPQNRAALLVRAQAEIDLGLIGGAGLDLAVLNSIDPAFPSLNYTRTLLARAKGAKDEELVACLAMHPNDPGERARILELQGHVEDSISLLTEATQDKKDICRGDYLTQLADLQFRYHRSSSFHTYEAAVSDMREKKDGIGRESDSALTEMKLMGAYWAIGERDKALNLALAVSRTVVEDKKYYYARRHLARPLLAALALTKAGIGSPEDREQAQVLLEKALKFVQKDHAEMDERYLIAIAVKSNQKELLSELDGVLKRAPNLEWAQWGVLYLALEQGGNRMKLSSALPDDSLPRQIILAEDKLAENAHTQ